MERMSVATYMISIHGNITEEYESGPPERARKKTRPANTVKLPPPPSFSGIPKAIVTGMVNNFYYVSCGVSRMDGMSNESVYERFGMGHVSEGKKSGVVEEVKRQTLKWFGHMERMEESKMTRRVYVSEIEGGNIRGRPPVKWRDRVQEYVRERGERSLRNLEQSRRECQDRERWKLFCHGHPLVGAPRSRRPND